jgi:16S rRNA (adenine1518-N6/adenine1519-N6)-dimethyltransferase
MRIKPKKSLGQNFLSDRNILGKIVDSCGFTAADTVLEIGAGRGELTRLIAPKVKKLYAFEIDSSLVPLLNESLRDAGNTQVIHQDILKARLSRYIKASEGKSIVVGNIPYYISTPILEKLFEAGKYIKRIYLTVQKEFAQRVVAVPGSKAYGSLSCFVQYHGRAQIKFIIKKGSFFPAPKVDSAFLEIGLRSKPLLNNADEERFFTVVRAAFNQRRKTLRNSLFHVINPDKLNEYLTRQKISPDVRPEELSLDSLVGLSKSANSRNLIK